MTDQTQQTQTQNTEPGGDQAKAAERPEGLPDQFWDTEKSAVKWGELLPGYQSLADADAVRREAEKDIPEAHTGYELALPEGFEVPEGFEFMAADDPRAEAIQKWAHGQRLKPAAVKELLGIYAGERVEALKASQAELSKLGQMGKQRVADLRVALHGRLSADQASALSESLSTAEAVRAVEALLAGAKKQPPSPKDAKTVETDALAALPPGRRMMAMMVGGRK